jgi:hypothetical protein
MKRKFNIWYLVSFLILALVVGVYFGGQALTKSSVKGIDFIPVSPTKFVSDNVVFCKTVSNLNSADKSTELLWFQAATYSPVSVRKDMISLYNIVREGNGNPITLVAAQAEGKRVCGSS